MDFLAPGGERRPQKSRAARSLLDLIDPRCELTAAEREAVEAAGTNVARIRDSSAVPLGRPSTTDGDFVGRRSSSSASVSHSAFDARGDAPFSAGGSGAPAAATGATASLFSVSEPSDEHMATSKFVPSPDCYRSSPRCNMQSARRTRRGTAEADFSAWGVTGENPARVAVSRTFGQEPQRSAIAAILGGAGFKERVLDLDTPSSDLLLNDSTDSNRSDERLGGDQAWESLRGTGFLQVEEHAPEDVALDFQQALKDPAKEEVSPTGDSSETVSPAEDSSGARSQSSLESATKKERSSRAPDHIDLTGDEEPTHTSGNCIQDANDATKATRSSGTNIPTPAAAIELDCDIKMKAPQERAEFTIDKTSNVLRGMGKSQDASLLQSGQTCRDGRDGASRAPDRAGKREKQRPRSASPVETSAVTFPPLRPLGSAGSSSDSSTSEDEGGPEEYEVEEILGSRQGVDGKKEWLVKWAGYDSGDNTWEPDEHLEHFKHRTDLFGQRSAESNGNMSDDSVDRPAAKKPHAAEPASPKSATASPPGKPSPSPAPVAIAAAEAREDVAVTGEDAGEGKNATGANGPNIDCHNVPPDSGCVDPQAAQKKQAVAEIAPPKRPTEDAGEDAAQPAQKRRRPLPTRELQDLDYETKIVPPDTHGGRARRVKSPGKAASGAVPAKAQPRIGSTVEVFWQTEKKWFRGVIQQMKATGNGQDMEYLVKYDDGEWEWELNDHDMKILA